MQIAKKLLFLAYVIFTGSITAMNSKTIDKINYYKNVLKNNDLKSIDFLSFNIINNKKITENLAIVYNDQLIDDENTLRAFSSLAIDRIDSKYYCIVDDLVNALKATESKSPQKEKFNQSYLKQFFNNRQFGYGFTAGIATIGLLKLCSWFQSSQNS